MARTVVQYIQDILREVRGQATPSEARQALNNSIDYVDSKGNWEFLLKSSNLSIVAPYRTGTVSITAGGTAVTSSGATWSTAWKYRDLLFSVREIPYIISTFPSNTTATLASPVSGTTDIVDATYVLYQARYALPSDCEPGRDFFVRGPNGSGPRGDGIITKLGRLTFEHKATFQQTGQVIHYTDDEFDETNRSATIRLWPYPTSSAEYHLVYYRKMTIPTEDDSYVMVPEAFEKMLINRSSAEIMRSKNMGAWQVLAQEAENMMRALHGRFTSSSGYDQSLQSIGGDVPMWAESDLLHVYGWDGWGGWRG